MKKTLSIFVDESGNFQYPDKDSRFYIIGMVFHDQSKDIKQYVDDLDRVEYDIGIENHCFHAGPLIRKEKEYAILNRHFRGRIFSRMMAFAHRVDFKYHYLATWNCKHINNPQTLPKIIKVCEENGFKCPLIGTPDQLKEVRDEND